MDSEPIRVAQIVGKLCAGGVEAVVFNYCSQMDKSKFQFDFYYSSDSTVNPPKVLIDAGCEFHKIPPYQCLPQYLKALKKCFKEKNYSIVHSHMNTVNIFPLFIAMIAKLPVRINHNHSTAGKGETKRNILKYALRPFAKLFATEYCACSRYAGKWLFGTKSMKNGEVTVFNNAIDIERFRYNSNKREDIRKKLGLEGKFVVGHVGRFCFQKNHEFLIDTFAELHKKNADAILLLIGVGNLIDKVKEKVHVLGLADSVKFLGVRNDVDHLYQGMDVFVFPSHYEGLGIAGIEAQASGLPCVFSDSITKEVKVTNESVMLSLSAGAEKWADTILKYKNHQRRDTSEDVRKAGFDIKEEAHKLEIFYDTLKMQK